MIKIKNVTKKYNNKKVVNNVSLNIEKGKITSFIGPNGAGKSTLLSIISRILKAQDGEIYIDEREIKAWDNRSLAKKISILKQSNNIGIKLTVKELVSFGRFPYSQGSLTKEDISQINRSIEYMRLKEIENKYIDELSGGQRQRAYIAMVIAQNTDYILLDEPLNNLDMKHSVEIMKILRSLVDELGKTVIIVIHDINFASCYSDYVVALKNGKIVNKGLTKDIVKEELLEKIYEINFNVQNINNKNICVYF